MNQIAYFFFILLDPDSNSIDKKEQCFFLLTVFRM